MRQISLLPGGCHQCSQPVVYASPNIIIFASKLSFYIIDATTFVIKKIITTQLSSMLSMSVNPNNENFVVVSGSDRYLSVWKLDCEECVQKVNVPADIVVWDPHDQNNVAVITNVNKNKVAIFSWYVKSHN